MLAAAEASAKPVVVIFLGADPSSITRNGVYGAAYLAQAADMAVALAKDRHPSSGRPSRCRTRCAGGSPMPRAAMAPSQRFVRGIFSGGTFCFEAQLIHAAAGITAFSNTPTDGNSAARADRAVSQENTIIDMGDDEFTQGRPHPMIDPSLRDARIREEVDDPTTAVVLFDVVLGYGSPLDPAVRAARRHRSARGQPPKRRAARSRSSATCAAPTPDPQNRARTSWPALQGRRCPGRVVQCRSRRLVGHA